MADAADLEQNTSGAVSSPLVRRQRVFLWITSGAAAMAIAGLVGSMWVKSPAQLAASQGPPTASVLTAQVQYKVLAQQVVVRGNVLSGSSVQVTPTSAQGASALVVTGEPVAAGSTITPGEVLAQVSGRPIIALPGTIPAYRDLKPGDQGSDISELQSALRSLGYNDSDPVGTFGPGTKTVVKDLYQHLGYDPATTGGHDDQGDQATLQADAQAVTAAQHTLTQASEQLSHDRSVLPHGSPTITNDEQNVQWDEQALATVQQSESQEIANTGYELPLNEFAFIPEFPATLIAVNGAVGANVASPLLTIDTGKLVVNAVVQQTDEVMLRQGMSVQIDSEVLGKATTGKLTSIGPYSNNAGNTQQQASAAGAAALAQSANGTSQGTPGYPVTITPASPLDPTTWLGQNVRLTITAASTPGKVLAVPVAAITTSANGDTSVLVYDARTDAERNVPVTVGVTANGMCAVTPATAGTLKTGQTVVTGQ